MKSIIKTDVLTKYVHQTVKEAYFRLMYEYMSYTNASIILQKRSTHTHNVKISKCSCFMTEFVVLLQLTARHSRFIY
jgi:hypothetical protein